MEGRTAPNKEISSGTRWLPARHLCVGHKTGRRTGAEPFIFTCAPHKKEREGGRAGTARAGPAVRGRLRHGAAERTVCVGLRPVAATGPDPRGQSRGCSLLAGAVWIRDRAASWRPRSSRAPVPTLQPRGSTAQQRGPMRGLTCVPRVVGPASPRAPTHPLPRLVAGSPLWAVGQVPAPPTPGQEHQHPIRDHPGRLQML